MSPTLLTWLMAACFLVGLALVALGLPGLWVMVAAVMAYGWLTDFERIGLATILVVVALAVVGEVIEAWLGFGLARRYGGSKRAGWGALLGRAAATAAKIAVGLVIAVVALFAAVRG